MAEEHVYQTYLKDCNCEYGGIILHNGVAVCRWCRTPYAKGSLINYSHVHFKKETKDKDYEVLSFINKNNNTVLAVTDIPPCYVVNDYLPWNSLYNIHSVKRLSDGEVFNVGDILTNLGMDNGDYPIKSINAINGTIAFGYGNSGVIIINYAKKANIKKHLFTTEDGVEIFDKGREIYIVNPDNFEEWTSNGASCTQSPFLKYFSSEQKRFEYLLDNKPIQVSFNELEKIIWGKSGTWPYNDGLKKFFKQKIQTYER